MKKICLTFIVLSVMFIGNVWAQGEGIVWKKGFSDALKEARAKGKPLMLDFTADWCKPCQAMDKEFWVRPDVIEATKPFIAVKLNYDTETALISKYGVSAIPFVAFTDPLGNLVTFRRGFSGKNATELTEIFDLMPKDFTAFLPLYEAVEKDKNNGEALLQIADKYRQAKMLSLSNDFYKKALKTPSVTGDEAKRERILANLAVTYYQMKFYDKAVDNAEEYIKALPKGKNRETVYQVLILATAYRGKKKEANKLLALFKTEFPSSAKTESLAKEIEIAEKPKP